MEEKEMKKYQQQAVPVVLIDQYMPEDEIRLFDLWNVLMRRKMIIFIIVFVFLLASVVYSMLVSPVYRVQTMLLPPLLTQMDGLGDQDVSPKDAFNLFVQNLYSKKMRHRYFSKHEEARRLVANHGAADNESTFKHFDSALSIGQTKGNKEGITISFEGGDANLAVQLLNGFVENVNKETVYELVANQTAKIAAEEQKLSGNIAVKRSMAVERRQDKIDKLEAGAVIAERLGIKDPMVAANGRTSMSPDHQADAGTPLYMMGYRALRAEARMLRQRKNDDAFIPDLRDMQEKLSLLKSIRFDLSTISSVRINQPASVPDYPVRPKRRMIVGVGLFGGIVVGVLMAFFVDIAMRARRQRENENGAA